MIPLSNNEIHESSKKDTSSPQIKPGSVLCAKEVLQDPHFDGTVVLICAHDTTGTYGLVLNRITHMPLSEIFDGLGAIPLSREIHIGGPVEENELQIIDISNTPAKDALEIAPGVFIGGDWKELNQMLSSEPDTTRLFLGYAGWGSGQLASEIALGAWDSFSVDVKKLLLNCHHLAGADLFAIQSFLRSISL